MDDPTQAGGEAPRAGVAGTSNAQPATGESWPGGAEANPAGIAGAESAPAGEAGPPVQASAIQRGLLAWLAIISVGGIACVLLGHAEGALLFAGAGAFALAQATDAAASLEGYRVFVRAQLPRRSVQGVMFRAAVRSLVPLVGALLYASLGSFAMTADPARPQRFAAAWCAVAAAASLATVARPVANGAMRLLFGAQAGRTRRLSARVVLLALFLPVPGVLLGPSLIAVVRASNTPLADPGALVAQLLGEIAIALAGVGWLVRRDARAVLERLGLTAMRPAHAAIAVAGLLALVVLNFGSDWAERTFFHALWVQDGDVTRLIAGSMPLATALLLGVSAGVGEEVVVRGALQPRLGVFLSAIVFASGHVQYTWFGMTTIALLGVLLGVIRGRANTTTAIVVHAAYDVYAALTANT